MKQFLMIAVAVVSSYAANAQVTKISVAKPVLSRVEAQPTKITVTKPMSAEDSQAVEAILKDLNAADYNVTVKDNQNTVRSYGALGKAKVVGGNQMVKIGANGASASVVHSTLTSFFSKTANTANQAALARLQTITNKYQ